MAALVRKCVFSAITSTLRLPLISTATRNFHTILYPLQIQISPTLWAEPLKKKKRIDPAIVKMRLDRKKRKLEKEIRRHEKVAKKLKPIDEMAVTPKFRREASLRMRKTEPITLQESDYQARLSRLWSNYRCQQHLYEMQLMERLVASQNQALMELRDESEELYQEAVQLDPQLVPFVASGPVRTPPIDNYDSPDGEYVDITRKWD